MVSVRHSSNNSCADGHRFRIEFSRGNILTQPAVDAAIEEMLFTGGALNRHLLGGECAEQIPNQSVRFSG
jgi:hypothetical protein